LERRTAALQTISLSQVLDRAELQTRVDRKYVVPAAVCEVLLPQLGREYTPPDIGGLRRFRCSSTYFGRPDLLTFRQHRQGHRHRSEIRTRAYLDSGKCAFEVKLAGARDGTDKRRMLYDIDRRGELDGTARDFLEDVLLTAYRTKAPGAAVPAATTAYLRSTLVQRSGSSRVTMDAALTCAKNGAVVTADPGMPLIESKSEWADAPVDRILRDHVARAVKISKYCVAVALLHPRMRANPWHPAMRAFFDGRGPFTGPPGQGR
jgi:hypothetical protein